MRTNKTRIAISIQWLRFGIVAFAFLFCISSFAESAPQKNSEKSLHSLIESSIEERELNEVKVLELVSTDSKSSKKAKLVRLPVSKKLNLSQGY